MALTLVEAAKLNSGDVERAAVIEIFARESDVMAALPVDDITGNSLRYNLEAALPGIGFRGVNEAYAESVGVINPQVESLAIAGGDLDVDRFIVQTMGAGARATHSAMKAKALAQALAAKVIKGDSASDPREFDGLQVRLTGNQLVSEGNTSGGDPLQLATLDDAIDRVDSPTHIILNKSLRRRFAAAARTTAVGGNVLYTVDQFGRRIMTYNGLPLLVGYEGGGGDEILPFSEAGAGGGTTASSVYVVSMGAGRFQGLQNGIMDVRDLGELDTAPVFRTRVEWFFTIALMHPRAASRIWGVSDAAIAA